MANTLGGRISELLLRQGVSQKELAERIGVTEASMSRYIKNEREPKAAIVANIATALHTTTDYLLGAVKEDDNEFATIKRLIARNAKSMTAKQKRELLSDLLGDD